MQIAETGVSSVEVREGIALEKGNSARICMLIRSLEEECCRPFGQTSAVDGKSAEQLHTLSMIDNFYHVLKVRGNIATPIGLTKFGRYPLRFHWWQQIL